MTDKKLEKIEKALGKELMADLEAQDVAALKNRLVAAELSINHATDELEANPDYQRVKEDLKALSEGLREVKKRQNAIIQYSLSLIESKGAS